MKILLFACPHVIPNPYAVIFSVEHKKSILRNFNAAVLNTYKKEKKDKPVFQVFVAQVGCH